MRSGLRFMVLKIQIRRDERLPNPVQVGMTVRHTRRPIGRKLSNGRGLLTRGRYHRQPKENGHGGRPGSNHYAAKPITHIKRSSR